jgi:hypothetical protein
MILWLPSYPPSGNTMLRTVFGLELYSVYIMVQAEAAEARLKEMLAKDKEIISLHEICEERVRLLEKMTKPTSRTPSSAAARRP